MYSGITKIHYRKTVGHVLTIDFSLGTCQRPGIPPPLPRDLADLKTRIIATVENIDAPMLTRVWQELEYCVDVCCVTCDAHIEHL
jgi:hypothetical protein